MPKYYRPKDHFGMVSKAEIFKFVSKAKDPDMQTCLSIVWLTGARISEVVALTRQDIEEDVDGFVQFTIAAKKGGKTGRPTFTRKDPFIVEIMNYIKDKKPEERILRLKNKRSYQYKLHDLNGIIYPKRKTKWLTFHYLRHSRITYLARMGAKPIEIKDWTGHRSAAFEDYFSQQRVRRFAGKIK